MYNSKRALLTAAIFIAALPLVSCSYWNQITEQHKNEPVPEETIALPHTAQEQNGGPHKIGVEEVPGPNNDYEVKTFFADYKRYRIGDVVPDLYRSKPYHITNYKIRHLPTPEPDSHWTYMGGNYVLITDAEGKILQAKSGAIFY